MREVQFDGLVGGTHNYGGLSAGNVASTAHGGKESNPRGAALQGLDKMKFVRDLGVLQGVFPPHQRPHLPTLRALGLRGSDEEMIAAAASGDAQLLRLASSASAMWTANAATVTPSCDAADGKTHFTPANLSEMFHRSIEAPVTTRLLRTIFAGDGFVVHDPLPPNQFADEGAANHTRLSTSKGAVHLFAWGRAAFGKRAKPKHYPARQTLEASEAIARRHLVPAEMARFPQQHPGGIDAGGFHTDVLAVGNERFLMLHELAFLGKNGLVDDLKKALGDELSVMAVSDAELPAKSAIAAYPFNSQVLSVGDSGEMCIVAPEDVKEDPHAHAFLEKVAASGGPVKKVHYLDVRQSMHNGGGPACLRLRVPLSEAERSQVQSGARVFLDEALERDLRTWVEKHYRDKLVSDDLRDPKLARETMTALDELTKLLRLGNLYDFQRAAPATDMA